MARQKYKDFLAKYPLIKWKDAGSLLKVPIYKGISWLCKALNIPEERRTSLALDTVGGLIDGIGMKYDTLTERIMYDVLPKFEIWRDFARGSSVIDRMYTLELDSDQLPLFMQAKGAEPPTMQELQENARFIVENGQSPYNGPNDLIPDDKLTYLYSNSFNNLAIAKYMRGDVDEPKIRDPAKLRKWLVREDTWAIQQYGNSRGAVVKDGGVEMEINSITIDGTPCTVRAYGKPSKLRSWWYWFVGDVLYDTFTNIFYPAQDFFAEAYSPEGFQSKIEDKFKRVAKSRRGFFNPRYPALTYELD